MHAVARKPKVQQTATADHAKQMPETRLEFVEGEANTLALGRYSYNFNSISIYPGEVINTNQKLTVNKPGDIHEREAEQIAERVMLTPAHTVMQVAPVSIQRYHGEQDINSDVAPGSINQVLAGAGRPLENGLRHDMERKFGHDFSRVRIFSGATAAQSTRDVHANAYTVGHKIVFGTGCYEPQTVNGRRLIAHELTHVLQQSRSATNHTGLQRDAQKPAAASAKVQAAKDKLKTKYGLKNISEENGVTWTETELRRIDMAFSKMSKQEQARLHDVTIILTDKFEPIKRKGKTIPIAGETTGTWQIKFIRKGVNNNTILHEAGHILHNNVIAEAEKEFHKSKAAADIEAARKRFSQAADKAPKRFYLSQDQNQSLLQFNTSLNQVSVAAADYQSSGDDRAAKKDMLKSAQDACDVDRFAVEQFKSDPGAKAWLEVHDRQGDWVVALEKFMEEKEKNIGPVKNLREFVDIVNKHKLARRSFVPFTPYADDNWPDKPQEFFSEAYASWRTNPTYMKNHGRALFVWFEAKGHLGPKQTPPPAPKAPIKIPRPKFPKGMQGKAPVVEELLHEAAETFLPAVEGAVNMLDQLLPAP